jgi:hypothetical protein
MGFCIFICVLIKSLVATLPEELFLTLIEKGKKKTQEVWLPSASVVKGHFFCTFFRQMMIADSFASFFLVFDCQT